MSLRKYLAVGGAAVMLGVAAIGASIVQAQATPTPAPTPGQSQRQAVGDRYLAALAARLNVTVDQLRAAMQGARQDAGIPDRAARPPSNGRGPGGGPGFGRGGLGFLGQQTDALAALFKITPAELRQELGGKTLAEVAAAHNVTVPATVNTIVTTANQQIDQLAAQRNIPAERVTAMKEQVSQRAQDFVTNHRFGQPRNRTTSTSS